MIDDIAALREQYLADARTPLRLWGFGLSVLSLAVVAFLVSRVAPPLTLLLIVGWLLCAFTFASLLGTYRAVRDLEGWVNGRMWVGISGTLQHRWADGLLIVGDEEWSYPRVERADGWTPRRDAIVDVVAAKRHSREPYEIALTASGTAFKLGWIRATRNR